MAKKQSRKAPVGNSAGRSAADLLDGDPGPTRELRASEAKRLSGWLSSATTLLNQMAERRENAAPGTPPSLREDAAAISRLTTNDDNWSFLNPGDPVFMIRQQLLDLLIDPRHEIDKECGYPADITPIMYHLMAQRDGIAKRIVRLEPNESWALDPWVYEDEDADEETPFEQDWNSLLKRLNVWHWLHRVDVLSGVARYGVLLLGFDDGRPYSEPCCDLDERGLPTLPKKGKKAPQLLFLRAFEEVGAQVLQREINPRNPRFGQPVRYLLTFRELDITEPAMLGTTAGGMTTSQVHWTRIIHFADNCEMSEIYGDPRMKAVWNRLMDLRKTMGGSAEMFWKGAFPGISFELQPGVGDVDMDTESLRAQMEAYQNGLQRYLSVAGLTAKSLSPQIADPKAHVDAQMEQIACSLGIPQRILFGSEEAKLSSTQDARTWNKRLVRRQGKYLTPRVIRPFVDRLIDMGTIRPPKEAHEYEVWWPDLNVTTPAEKADVALKVTQTLQAYLQGGVDQILPPQQFFQMVLEWDEHQMEEVLKAQKEYLQTRTQEFAPTPGVEGKLAPSQGGESEVQAEAAAKNPVEEN